MVSLTSSHIKDRTPWPSSKGATFYIRSLNFNFAVHHMLCHLKDYQVTICNLPGGNFTLEIDSLKHLLT